MREHNNTNRDVNSYVTKQEKENTWNAVYTQCLTLMCVQLPYICYSLFINA